jgi:hypothetical protein
MTAASVNGPFYPLDNGIVLALARGAALGQRIEATYSLLDGSIVPVDSIVTNQSGVSHAHPNRPSIAAPSRCRRELVQHERCPQGEARSVGGCAAVPRRPRAPWRPAPPLCARPVSHRAPASRGPVVPRFWTRTASCPFNRHFVCWHWSRFAPPSSRRPVFRGFTPSDRRPRRTCQRAVSMSGGLLHCTGGAF